jgi:hypothetical protein
MRDAFLWDVFLSHSSRDKDKVRILAQGLRDLGLRVWLDEWLIKPGDDIYGAIENGLEYSRTLLLCMSQAAIDSDWVKLERNTTIFRDPQNKDRRFIPLLLEECTPPATIRRLAHFDWQDGNRANLAKLVEICNPPVRRVRFKFQRGATKLVLPTGTMRSDSPLYVRREADIYSSIAAQQVAETIMIKAARQMGKSSLLLSYLAACRKAGKKTVLLDLGSLCSDDDMADYPSFLSVLAQEIWDQLGRPAEAGPRKIHRHHEMTKYVERTLLSCVDGSLVIAFDEMDRVLGRPFQSDFFSMLRSWHNQRANLATNWSKLGLALVISTEPYLFITDVLRSPFNVGLSIELRYFNASECRNLSQVYDLRLSGKDLAQLMELLNGHPHLTQLAFYALAGPQSMNFDALIAKAATRDGPFGAHLRALEYKLLDDRGDRLLAAMREVVGGSELPNKDDFYRLHGAGLVREEKNSVVPSNGLYAGFFS